MGAELNLLPDKNESNKDVQRILLTDQAATQLVQRLATGDIAALEALYRAYQKQIFLTALKRLNGDRDAAQDITQQTFEALIDEPEAYDPEKGKLIAWLQGIAYRKAMDRYRELGKTEPVEDPDDEIESLSATATAELDSTLDEEARRTALMQCLDKLPRDIRDTIISAWLQEMTYAEVGKILNIKEGTVKSRVFNAMPRLRTCLEKRLGATPWQ